VDTQRRLAIINSDAKREPVLPDPDGVASVLVDLRMRAFARTPYDHLLTELSTVDAAERAIADGADAVYIDTVGDYGIARLRAASPVPVVGAGEASLAHMASLGRRFTIVTVWPRSMDYIYAERLAACRGGDLATDVHYISDEPELDLVGTDAGVKARMRRNESDIVATIVAACRRAAAVDGTDLVLFGCTCMTPVADEVAAHTGLEILDPSKVGLRAAHAAALGGERFDAPATSRLGAVGALVDAHLHRHGETRVGAGAVDRGFALSRGDASGVSVESTVDDCDVCVVLPTAGRNA
jgi:allantoin racemase